MTKKQPAWDEAYCAAKSFTAVVDGKAAGMWTDAEACRYAMDLLQALQRDIKQYLGAEE